ncbi:MAG: hypothetical protein SFU84_03835 [Gemmatimonadales bacterium]|nr:hypothetical protein [Gemmatimonadales bacterium]
MDDGTRQIGGAEQSLEDVHPAAYLGEVGCRVQQGPRDSSTVAVKRFGGGFLRFACTAVPRDSVRAAIRRYRDAGAAAIGGAMASSGSPGGGGEGEDGLVYAYTTFTCDLTHIWQWDAAAGHYYYLWTTGECTFLEHWYNPNVGGPASPNPALPVVDSLGWDEEDLTSPLPLGGRFAILDGVSLEKPDCSRPTQLTPEESVWCNALGPSATQLGRINAAISRMRSAGGICATRADTLAAVIANGGLKIFPSGTSGSSMGFAPRGGGAGGWLALSSDMTDVFYERKRAGIDPPTGLQITLQFALAHEGDHLAGLPHTDAEGLLTANSISCSDIPHQRPLD